jgi:hypothetical protein
LLGRRGTESSKTFICAGTYSEHQAALPQPGKEKSKKATSAGLWADIVRRRGGCPFVATVQEARACFQPTELSKIIRLDRCFAEQYGFEKCTVGGAENGGPDPNVWRVTNFCPHNCRPPMHSKRGRCEADFVPNPAPKRQTAHPFRGVGAA